MNSHNGTETRAMIFQDPAVENLSQWTKV